jgi:GntR family phosphonate transport system transcriptional regulator
MTGDGPSVQRRSGVALWRQIEQTVARQIAQGVFRPGEQLPTEQALAERFTVNRHTLRRAMSELEERGLVRIEQGRGSFVQEPVVAYSLGKRTRFSENLSRGGRTPGGALVRISEEPARAAVARGLGLSRGATVVVIETVGDADGQRISYGRHHFAKQRFGGIASAYRREGSITSALRSLGIDDYLRRSTTVLSRMPTAEEARHLQQPRSRPVLVAESVNIDDRGKPIEYGIAVFASDWVQLVVEP